jgi:hypothetical protein
MEYYSDMKNDVLSFATKWMGLGGQHGKQNKPDTERQVPNVLSHMQKVKNKNVSRKW